MTYYTCRREGMCCSSAFISIQAIWMFVVGAYVAYYYIHFTIGYFEFWKGAEVLEDSGSIIHIIYILKPTYFDYLFYYDSAICIIIVDSAITKIKKNPPIRFNIAHCVNSVQLRSQFSIFWAPSSRMIWHSNLSKASSIHYKLSPLRAQNTVHT